MTKVADLSVGTVFSYKGERFTVITPRGRLNTYSLDNQMFVDFGLETDVEASGELIDVMQAVIEEKLSGLRKQVEELKEQLRAEQVKRRQFVDALDALRDALDEDDD